MTFESDKKIKAVYLPGQPIHTGLTVYSENLIDIIIETFADVTDAEREFIFEQMDFLKEPLICILAHWPYLEGKFVFYIIDTSDSRYSGPLAGPSSPYQKRDTGKDIILGMVYKKERSKPFWDFSLPKYDWHFEGYHQLKNIDHDDLINKALSTFQKFVSANLKVYRDKRIATVNRFLS